MNSIFKRFALLLTMFGLVILTGCASTSKVNPMRTGMLVTYAVSPGADGVTTTKTDYCTFRRQVSLDKAKAYEDDPALLVQDDACTEFGQLALHGSPALAGELVKVGTSASANGLVNFAIQTELQNRQGKICANGGCINTVNVNNNSNVAHGGQGGRGGNAAALAGSSSSANAGVTGGGGCATCAFKPN